jgi:hypothetical protein
MSADTPHTNGTSRHDRRPENRSTFTLREKLDWAYSVPLTAGNRVSVTSMRHVLSVLAWRWSDGCGASCYPSTSTIGHTIGLSSDQVQRALDELDRQGLITRHRRERERGRLGTYDYRLMLTRPHHAGRSTPVEDERPDRTMPGGEAVTRPHGAVDQTAPCVETRPHHAGTEQPIENNPPNRHRNRTEITSENIAHRAAELIVEDKLRKNEELDSPEAVAHWHANRLLRDKAGRLDRLVTYTDCSLDELAQCLRDGTTPPPRPTLYTPPAVDRITPERQRAALDRGRRGGDDEAGEVDDQANNDGLTDPEPPAGTT